MGIRARVSWHEVLGVKTVRQGFHDIESLVLANPTVQVSWWMSASIALYPVFRILAVFTGRGYLPGNMSLAEYRQTIPLGTFVKDWQHSKLGDELHRYAPQAFGEKRERIVGDTPDGRLVSIDELSATEASSAGALEEKRRTHNRWRGLAITSGVALGEMLLILVVAPWWHGVMQPVFGASEHLPGRIMLEDTGYSAMSLSANGKTLASGLQVYSVPDGALIQTIPLPEGGREGSRSIESVALSSDGTTLAAGDDEGYAYIWDIAESKLLQTFSVTQPVIIYERLLGGFTSIAYVHSVALSPDGRMLAAIGPPGIIKLWSTENGTLLHEMKSSREGKWLGATMKLFFSPDGQTIISVVVGEVEVWSAQSGTLKYKLYEDDMVEDIAFSADSKTMALGTLHGGISLWDVANNALVKTIKPKGHDVQESVNALALAPDAQTLIAGLHDGSLRVWNVIDGSSRIKRDRDGKEVDWIALTPDGKTLIYSKGYGTVMLWEMPSD